MNKLNIFNDSFFSDLFKDKCDDFEIRYECCIPKTRRNRRGIPSTESGFDDVSNNVRSLLANYTKSIDDLKYESRLQFGNGTEPLEFLVWVEIRSILIDLIQSRNISRSMNSTINTEEINSRTNSNSNYKHTLNYFFFFLLIIPVIIISNRCKLCNLTMRRRRLIREKTHAEQAVKNIQKKREHVSIDANGWRQTGNEKFQNLKSCDEKEMKKIFGLKKNSSYQTFI